MTLVLHGPSFNPALPIITPEALATSINTEFTSFWLPLAGGTMIGALNLAGVSTAPTAAPGTNTTQIASTAFVTAATTTATGAYLPLVGGSLAGPGNLSVGGTLNVTGAVTASSTLNVTGASTITTLAATKGFFNPITFQIVSGRAQEVFNSATALAGTITVNGTNGWNGIDIPSDNLAMNTGISQALADFQINHNFGGTSWTGARNGIVVNMVQTAAINLGAGGGLIGAVSGIQSSVNLTNTFGGSGLTSSTAAGAATALNPYLIMGAGYVNGGGGSGMEIDVGARSGASFLDKYGAIIVLDSLDAVQGTRSDAALVFANQADQGVARGWKAMISTGAPAGFNPVATDGALWILTSHQGGTVGTQAKGLSWANGTFTTSAIETPGFTVGGTGIATALHFNVGVNQVVGARDAGWTAMTGTPDKATAFATSSVTLAQLAGRVMSMQATLTAHGLLGA